MTRQALTTEPCTDTLKIQVSATGRQRPDSADDVATAASAATGDAVSTDVAAETADYFRHAATGGTTTRLPNRQTSLVGGEMVDRKSVMNKMQQLPTSKKT